MALIYIATLRGRTCVGTSALTGPFKKLQCLVRFRFVARMSVPGELRCGSVDELAQRMS
jgi:hypothetical protein